MWYILALACGGGDSPAPAASAPAAAAAVPAPPPAVAVGPEGPASIVVPALASIPTDAASVAEGEKVFTAKGCGGCHKFGSKLVGPDLAGLTSRRPTPWIQRMISEPETMTKQDPVAKDLFRTYMVQMTKQGVSADEMPKLLAYIKSSGG
jgi:hypothetical protein